MNPNQHNYSKADFKETIRGELESYLSGQGIDTSKNFTCLNPNHADHTPSMTFYKDDNKVYCHGCGAGWDIFDLYAVQQLGATPDADNRLLYNFADVYNALAQKLSIPTMKRNPEQAQRSKISQINQRFIELSQRSIDSQPAQDYLKKRGISSELAKKYHLGYLDKWVNPATALKGMHTTPTPRLIIPTGKDSYLARDIRADIPDNEKKYVKIKQGGQNLFNREALSDDSKPLFIVEGELDALSIMQVTNKANAVGLGSTTNLKLLKQAIQQTRQEKQKSHATYSPTILSALDNDSAGELATRQLEQICNNLNLDFYEVNYEGKDPNEALTSNLSKFQSTIEQTIKDPENYLTGFLKRIEARKNTKQYVPTGFKNLDKKLDGGLYPQLYVFGAISSLGKTTFLMQIADRIASRQHRPVFFFSLETSKDELTSKNLSRLTFELSSSSPQGLPQTARQISNGQWLDSEDNSQLFYKALGAYSSYYNLIKIVDGTQARPSARDIYSKVAIYCHQHPEQKPVIIVDYLQILKPISDQDTDKEKVTKSISEFKKTVSTFQVPVLVISSFNRANYKNAVSMESFKESGEIEYYADTLIGLQYKAMSKSFKDDNSQELAKAMQANPRKLEAVILKNRNGISNTSVDFTFNPKFNYFADFCRLE